MLVTSCLSFLASFSLPSAQAATIVKTVADGGDWTSLNAASPITAMNPNEVNLDVRSRNIAGTLRHNVVALRFNIGALTEDVVSANLQLYVQSLPVEADSFTLTIYGLVEGASKGSITDTSWTHLAGANQVAYNTMPGLVSVDNPLTSIAVAHTPGQTVALGTISYSGSQPGILTLNSTLALVDFLNADTDGYVTFLIESQVAASNQDFNIYFRSGAGTLSGSAIYPTLTLTTVPEPGVFGMLALGGLFLAGVARRKQTFSV